MTSPPSSRPYRVVSGLLDGVLAGQIGIGLGLGALCSTFGPVGREGVLRWFAVAAVLAPIGYWRTRRAGRSTLVSSTGVVTELAARRALACGLTAVLVTALGVFFVFRRFLA